MVRVFSMLMIDLLRFLALLGILAKKVLLFLMWTVISWETLVLGFGGLLRNGDKAWISSFYGNIGTSNNLHAKLLAMYHGLTLHGIKATVTFEAHLCGHNSQY